MNEWQEGRHARMPTYAARVNVIPSHHVLAHPWGLPYVTRDS